PPRAGTAEYHACWTGAVGGGMRRCPVCGRSLAGRDPRTRTCSAKCRREAARFRRVLGGRADGAYATLADLQNRRRNGPRVRAKTRWRPITPGHVLEVLAVNNIRPVKRRTRRRLLAVSRARRPLRE